MCNCKVCKYGREVRKNIDKIKSKKRKDFFEDMYSRLCNAENDYDFQRLKYDQLKEEKDNLELELTPLKSGEYSIFFDRRYVKTKKRKRLLCSIHWDERKHPLYDEICIVLKDIIDISEVLMVSRRVRSESLEDPNTPLFIGDVKRSFSAVNLRRQFKESSWGVVFFKKTNNEIDIEKDYLFQVDYRHHGV